MALSIYKKEPFSLKKKGLTLGIAGSGAGLGSLFMATHGYQI